MTGRISPPRKGERSSSMDDSGLDHRFDSGKGYKTKQSELDDVERYVAGCMLLRHVARGERDQAKKLCTDDARLVNYRDYDRRTALHLAASEGRLGIVNDLLNAGARPRPLVGQQRAVPAARRVERRRERREQLREAAAVVEQVGVFLLDAPEVVGAGLVAESAGATVDENDDLVGFEAERLGHVVAVDVRDALDFEEVVSGAETSDLVAAAVFRLLGDELGTGVVAEAFEDV